MPRIFSFDVFDTCLIRRIAFPTDLFLMLARDFRDVLEPQLGADYQFIFRDARIDAQIRVQQASGSEESNLLSTWKLLASHISGLDALSGFHKELEREKQFLQRNQCVHNRVLSARKKSGSIIFISDTYLPADFIREVLGEHGFWREGDRCYASSEFGITKRTGSLFSHVLAAEGVGPRDLLHFGDNEFSDFRVPTRLGIAAEHYRDVEFNRPERLLLQQAAAAGSEFVSRLVGEMRLHRLNGNPMETEATDHFVASMLAPLVFMFATWVLARAQSDGVKRLYFVSRDGYALCQVASKLAPGYGGIECKYLKVSRQALYLPSVTEITPQAMHWIRRAWEKANLEEMLSKLELDIQGAGAALQAWIGESGRDFELTTELDWNKFWSLLNSEPLHSKLLGLAAKRRADAIAYFRQQGLFDYREVALVDIGWFLTCQGALRKLLASENEAISVRGYYFGLHTQRRPYAEAGLAQAMQYEKPRDRADVLGQNEIFSRAVLLEHLFGCAPHGTVLRYERDEDDEVTTICAETPDQHLAANAEVLDSLLRFADSAAKAPWPPGEGIGMESLAERLTQLICAEPEARWRAAVGRIAASHDQAGLTSDILCAPYDWDETWLGRLKRAFLSLPHRKQRQRYWPELSLAATSKRVRLTLRLQTKIILPLRKLKSVLKLRVRLLRYHLM